MRELTIFARFHARPGQEDAVAALLLDSVARTSKEAGCLHIAAYRSTRDPRLHFIHSRWSDEAAFQVHADLPATNRFIANVEALSDAPADVHRTRALPQQI